MVPGEATVHKSACIKQPRAELRSKANQWTANERSVCRDDAQVSLANGVPYREILIAAVGTENMITSLGEPTGNYSEEGSACQKKRTNSV
jgi:hypothetical protein